MKLAQKYLIVRTPDEAELVFMCLAPVTLILLADAVRKQIPGAVPVSAGFVQFLSNGKESMVRTYGYSQSLNLEPREGDAALLALFASATETTNPAPVQ